jgi:hypothetical protein
MLDIRCQKEFQAAYEHAKKIGGKGLTTFCDAFFRYADDPTKKVTVVQDRAQFSFGFSIETRPDLNSQDWTYWYNGGIIYWGEGSDGPVWQTHT